MEPADVGICVPTPDFVWLTRSFVICCPGLEVRSAIVDIELIIDLAPASPDLTVRLDIELQEAGVRRPSPHVHNYAGWSGPGRHCARVRTPAPPLCDVAMYLRVSRSGMSKTFTCPAAVLDEARAAGFRWPA